MLINKDIIMLKSNEILTFYLFIILCFITITCDHEKDTKFLHEAGPILFISQRTGTNQLYSMNEDGSDIQQLTDDPDFPIGYARWSPDGKKIVVESSTGGLDLYGPALYVMDADGTHRLKITNAQGSNFNYTTGRYPQWSPDSKKIAFYRVMIPEGFAGTDIFTIEPYGKNEKQITHTSNMTEGVCDWSPDGNSFVVNIYGVTPRLPSIIIMAINGDYLKTISDTTVISGRGIWNKKNQILYYAWVNSNHNQEIFLYNCIDSTKTIIQTTTNMYKAPVDWSTDENSFLFNALDIVNGVYNSKFYRKNILNDSIFDITPFPEETGWNYATSWRKNND